MIEPFISNHTFIMDCAWHLLLFESTTVRRNEIKSWSHIEKAKKYFSTMANSGFYELMESTQLRQRVGFQ